MLKFYKPITPSLRFKVKLNTSKLNKKLKFKKLVFFYKKSNGKQKGIIITRHKFSGTKKLYRFINFKNNFINDRGVIVSIQYDPYRFSFISLIYFYSNIFSYRLTNVYDFVGKIIKNINDFYKEPFYTNIKKGSTFFLYDIPESFLISSIILDNRVIYGRAAGCFIKLYKKFINYKKQEYFGFIKLPSGMEKKISLFAKAVIGATSNSDRRFIVLGKAGTSFHYGVRPTVRGIAMNPIDHPHGGKTNGGRPSVSPWGRITK